MHSSIIKIGTLAALMISILSACPASADTGPSTFLALWAAFLSKPEIQQTLKQRRIMNEPPSVTSRLDQLIEGDITDLTALQTPSKRLLSVNLNRTFGSNTWDFPPPSGAFPGSLPIASKTQSDPDTPQTREAIQIARDIHAILVREVRQIQYALTTIAWEKQRIRELESFIADGDDSEIVSNWLRDSKVTLCNAEETLSETGLDLSRIQQLVGHKP